MVLLTGCGVKKQEHQKVLGELAAAKQSLDGINSELEKSSQDEADLENKIASDKIKIASQKQNLKNLKERSAALAEQIQNLETQEACVFQKAGEFLRNTDYQRALNKYKEFVAKFPQSYRATAANEQVTKIELMLKSQSQ